MFELKQCYEIYFHPQAKNGDCELEIQKQPDQKIAFLNEGIICDLPHIKRKHPLTFNFTAYANKSLGVDVTDTTGINEASSMEIILETGIDMQNGRHRRFRLIRLSNSID